MTRRSKNPAGLSIKCPECGAAAGKRCWRLGNRVHAARRDAFLLKAYGSTHKPAPVKVTHADGSVEVRKQPSKTRGRPGAKGRYAAELSVQRDRAQRQDAATRQQELKAAFLARQKAREAEAETPPES